MNYNKLQEKIKEFVETLDGVYKEHITDEALCALLHTLIDNNVDFTAKFSSKIENKIYGVGMIVFEQMFESRLGSIRGNTVAQKMLDFLKPIN